MSPWEGIPEFLMVAETGGFTAAGKRLNVSPSHISRQVARLEDRLGVRLLARSTRVVRLTEAGEAYHAKVSDLAAGIEEVNQAAAGQCAKLAGRVRISAAGIFAEDKIARALAKFAFDHPQLLIEMDFNSRNIDLIDQGFDLAIRYGTLSDSGLIARKLADRKLVCAAAPHYLADHGRPSHPRDLQGHSCLKTNQNHWSFREPDTGKRETYRVSGRWIANNGHALRHAAVAGLGIAYCPIENLETAIEDGELELILGDFIDTTPSTWLVYPERKYMPLRVRQVIDFLVETFAA